MESELEDWEPMRDRRTESAKKGIHNLTQVFLCYVSFYNKRWHCIRIGGLHQRIASPHGTAHGTWPHGRHTGHVPLPQTLLVFPPAGFRLATEKEMRTPSPMLPLEYGPLYRWECAYPVEPTVSRAVGSEQC